MVLSASLPSTEQRRELRRCWLGPSHGEQGLIPDAGQLPHDYTSPGMLEGFGCRGVGQGPLMQEREGERGGGGGVRATAVGPLANERQTPGGFSDYLTHCVHFWEGDHLAPGQIHRDRYGRECHRGPLQPSSVVSLRWSLPVTGKVLGCQRYITGGQHGSRAAAVDTGMAPALGRRKANAGDLEAGRRNTIYSNLSRGVSPGSQGPSGRLIDWPRGAPLKRHSLCQGLVYFTHIKDHMPQFHSTAGGPAPAPSP
ncbi:hypothetical protein EYF80_006700 [Liparis tanakae]|uniref:Uncharacterized protein n=1 Tax=Liparis tanakae TaxID=230148 RepID=A0A4Z2J0W2_9TELE|nr:hypothetical protein EYF80_006700 [Liparis tanakae]